MSLCFHGALAGLVGRQRLGESTSPSVGCVGITASRPCSSRPRRLPRMAMIAAAFISPIPGRARRRRLRSGPSLASVQMQMRRCRSRWRSRRRVAGPCRPWNRGTGAARGLRNTASSSAGSVAARPRRIQVADPALQLERTAEGLLDRDLLVEREPDQHRERIGDEQSIGGVVAGEGKSVGRGCHGQHGTASRTSRGPARRGWPPYNSPGRNAQPPARHCAEVRVSRRSATAITAGSANPWDTRPGWCGAT